jgi:cyanate permease
MAPILTGSFVAAFFAGAGLACAITIETANRLSKKHTAVKIANFFILLLLSWLRDLVNDSFEFFGAF